MDSKDVKLMADRLRKMQTKAPDGLGAYLGDGMPHTPNVPIRSQVLVSLLEELLLLRDQNLAQMKRFLESTRESLDDGISLALSHDSPAHGLWLRPSGPKGPL